MYGMKIKLDEKNVVVAINDICNTRGTFVPADNGSEFLSNYP